MTAEDMWDETLGDDEQRVVIAQFPYETDECRFGPLPFVRRGP